MQELIRTNRLIMVVAAFVLVIIIGLVTFKRPEVKYVLSPAESLALLNNPEAVITPEQAATLLKDNSGKTLFIDVRNSIAFENGHIKNAINIPVHDLFAKENRSVLRDLEKSGQEAVIYGETEQEACGPWLMLRQAGYKNVKLFTGTYSQLDPSNTDSLTRLLPQLSETARIDTAALKFVSASAGVTKSVSKPAEKEKKSVKPVKKQASSGGGC
jgi:rhodanese-related sulfurtransferase